MSALETDLRADAAAPAGQGQAWPLAAFAVLAAACYGTVVLFSVGAPLTLAAINKDAWQHIAALQALITDPIHPANPFVASAEGSRLFGPVHVAAALLARALGLSALGAYGLVAAGNLAALAAGQYMFGRAYFGRLGPLALFLVMMFGWWTPLIHTGFVSLLNLVEGTEYPATTGVAGGLILWAMTIRLIRRPRWSVAYPALTALLMANHQLSAGIAVIGAGCLGLLEPGTLQGRARTALLGALGLAAAAAWPYFNPYSVLLTAGSESWTGPSIDFYAPLTIAVALWPAAIGAFGLRRSTWAMLAIYTLAFLAGLFGLTVAYRFLMPIVMVLQIGLAQLVMRLWTRSRGLLALLLASSAAIQIALCLHYADSWVRIWRDHGNLLEQARALRLSGVAAAHDVAAWPVVAAGTKVVATPLPEPLIHDLSRRQADNAAIFDPATARDVRLSLLRRYDVRSLVIDESLESPAVPAALAEVAAPVARSGDLVRYDLRPWLGGALRPGTPQAPGH